MSRRSKHFPAAMERAEAPAHPDPLDPEDAALIRQQVKAGLARRRPGLKWFNSLELRAGKDYTEVAPMSEQLWQRFLATPPPMRARPNARCVVEFKEEGK
jgi:hypothetical protein